MNLLSKRWTPRPGDHIIQISTGQHAVIVGCQYAPLKSLIAVTARYYPDQYPERMQVNDIRRETLTERVLRLIKVGRP